MYVWNCFTIVSRCEILLDSVLDRVDATLTDLSQLSEDDQRRRRYLYDDRCLAMLIKGVCLRHKHVDDEALRCFEFIITQ